MQIAFIGLGEVATAFISSWDISRASLITAFDIKTNHPDTAEEIEFRSHNLQIKLAPNLTEALKFADVVFSTVTADQSAIVAKSASKLMRADTYFLDLNSCAPSTKRLSAKLMREKMIRYVDVAVMEPVYPKRHKVPLLISGDWSKEAMTFFDIFSMHCRIIEGEVGKASSIKMVRSIMVKGLEALTAECTLAAFAADVVDEVFPSLLDGHPRIDILARATYNFERSMRHGKRRAAEMDEVAKMVADLGLPNTLAQATANWQRLIAENTTNQFEAKKRRTLESYVDELLPRIKKMI